MGAIRLKNLTCAFLLILAGIVCNVGRAQNRPDFSGSWVLNKTKSKQRNPHQFLRQSMDVSQRDPDLEIDIRDQEPNGHEFRAYLHLKTDGTPVVAILGAPQRAVVRWEGSKMTIRWNLDGSASDCGGATAGRQGATPPFTWTWSLSPNGKLLVNEMHLYGDVTGDIEEHWVYDRKG